MITNLNGFDSVFQVLCDKDASFLDVPYNKKVLSQMFTFMKNKYIQQPTPKKLGRDVTVLVKDGQAKTAFDTSLRDKMMNEGAFTLTERVFDSDSKFGPEISESPLLVVVAFSGGRWLAGPLRKQFFELSGLF